MKNRKLLLSLLFFAVMGLMAGMTIANPSLYLEEEEPVTGWKTVGPSNVTGRVRVAMFDKYNYGVVYAGTVGGLYISVNNGKNWEELPLSNTVENVTALAQDENGIVYVGTGEGYYSVGLHNEDPSGRSNAISGRIGSGIYKIGSSSYTKEWATNLSTDEEKYAWAKENITFAHMNSTTVENRYDSFGEWAYINTMAFANGYLYVGTKNGGLKVSQNGEDSFTEIPMEGTSSLNIFDIVVNANGRVAVSYNNAGGSIAVSNPGSPLEFTKILNADETTEINADDAYLGRIRLSFGHNNPDYLYAFIASQYVSYSQDNEYTYADMNGLTVGVYRTRSIDEVEWKKINPGNFGSGSQLNYAMSIAVKDDNEEETVYTGGSHLQQGQDLNANDVFVWSALASPTVSDTSGLTYDYRNYQFLPSNIHTIAFMPNPKDIYDSIYMLITTDAGIYMYKYDTMERRVKWMPSNGINNLQTYKVSATPSGAVLAASQDNAIVYIPSISDTRESRGMKIWSINSPGYVVATQLDVAANSRSGSAVETSAIYRTLPTTKVRKPIMVARPYTTFARTYGYSGDFSSIDDQTWTYGGGNEARQELLNGFVLTDRTHAQFLTPTDFWETFDANTTNTLDSVQLKLSNYTYIRHNGEDIRTIAGQPISIGDSIIVPSDNLEYPFWYVFSEVDRDVDNYPTGDVLFSRWNENEDSIINIPQKVQSKMLLASEAGVFVCGKILDYTRTFSVGITDPTALKKNLTWARIYSTNNFTTNYNRRVRTVALSADGASAFISVDFYTNYSQYDSTLLIRIDGLNDVDINNGLNRAEGGYNGSVTEAGDFTQVVLGKYNRQISSIVSNPNNANQIVVTFDGYSTTADNILYSANAMESAPSFTALSSPDEENGKYAPVYTALFEATEGNTLFVGTDKGIYKTTNYASSSNTWTKEDIGAEIAVYDLWQQTKNLPAINLTTFSSTTSEDTRFEATANAGVIYAATYGKGILVNSDYKQENPDEINVGINDVKGVDVSATISLYPNPATTETVVSYTLASASNVVLNMYDINGRLLSVKDNGRQSKGAHAQLIDVSNMSKGVYVIQVVTDTETRTSKLIIN
ncbi:MAG: T9SS type A sorting domain-containing protein [Bacteroidales bacterium]|nr:T9SS type A sorting domain-containing protein [Bacteroidales bacterium]